MTLLEMMVAVMVGALVCAAAIYSLVFSLRSYQALTNYQGMNAKGRQAIDALSTDIRQANGCSTNATFSASTFTLLGTDPTTTNHVPYTIQYTYSSNATTLTRTYTESSNTQTKVLLTNLTSLAFSYYIRNPSNGSFGVFTNFGTAATCKLIQVDWNCSRTNYGSPIDSQSGESARIVIRKE